MRLLRRIAGMTAVALVTALLVSFSAYAHSGVHYSEAAHSRQSPHSDATAPEIAQLIARSPRGIHSPRVGVESETVQALAVSIARVTSNSCSTCCEGAQCLSCTGCCSTSIACGSICSTLHNAIVGDATGLPIGRLFLSLAFFNNAARGLHPTPLDRPPRA
jgi:hypothetical protein